MLEKVCCFVSGLLLGIFLSMLILLIVIDHSDGLLNNNDPARACFECGRHMKAEEFDLINNTYIYKCEKCGFTLITDIPMGSDN